MSNHPTTTPAKLRRFNTCPRWFWFQDVRGLKPEEPVGPALAVGNAVHEALARSFRLPSDRRSADAFEAQLRLVWPRHRKPYPFRDLLEEKECGEEAVAMLRGYADRTDLDVAVIAIEKSVETALGERRIRGRIDRVDDLNDGTVRIVDYKTGRKPIDPDDMRLDPAARIYLLLTEASVGPVSEVRFEYLRPETSVIWRPERDDLPHIADAVIADLDGIWDRRHYETAAGHPCQWCPFTGICAEGWAATSPADPERDTA